MREGTRISGDNLIQPLPIIGENSVVHETAKVADSATIGSQVRIDPHVQVGEGVSCGTGRSILLGAFGPRRGLSQITRRRTLADFEFLGCHWQQFAAIVPS